MKRLLGLTAAALLFGAVSYAPASASRTKICHNDVDEGFDHVIEVSDSSLPAHQAHGDEVPNNLDVGSACVIDVNPDT
jgi:hypothetical protein